MNDNIEIRSEEVQEVLSRPPHLLIRWGSISISIIILFLFIGSFFFSFPDTIDCRITITTTNPPSWAIAKTTGKIKHIFKRDNDSIRKNEILAIIENPANTSEALCLKDQLSRLNISQNTIIETCNLKSSNLGEIQNTYSSFIMALNQYNLNINLDMFTQKINAEELQLSAYNKYIEDLKRKEILIINQSKLNEIDYERERKLYESNLTSQSTLESVEQTLLSGKINIEEIKSDISNTEVQIAQISNRIIELNLEKKQEAIERAITLQNSLNELISAINQWEQKYVLMSPIDGILSYNTVWKENQDVAANDKVFSVVNNDSTNYIGKINFPVSGSGKVKINQKVNIKLDGYPYLEFGFITGKITTISTVSDNNEYVATVELPKQLITSYHKKINFNGELSGDSEIITEEQSIGMRILSPFKYIFKRNFMP